MEAVANRTGRTTEYKLGHYYLTFTEFEDGHCELEIHRCVPQLVFHSCDVKDMEVAKKNFVSLYEGERQKQLEVAEQMRADLMLGEVPSLDFNRLEKEKGVDFE